MARILAALMLVSIAQAQERQNLRFEDFPVQDIFRGTPAAPVLTQPWARMFRTRIREGISKGWGVAHYTGPRLLASEDVIHGVARQPGEERAGPNFAGHYYVVQWGCGTGCLRMAVVDAVTGMVFPPPLSMDKQQDPSALPPFGMGPALVDYRLNSRLFVMHTCDLDKSQPTSSSDLPCMISYFTIESSGFKLIYSSEYELPFGPQR